jgi:hypothetical protein
VAITTRLQFAKGMTELEAVQVAELTPDEARNIFTRRMKLQNPDSEMQKEIDAVSTELGHFALAVSLAAAYVASTRRLRAHLANYLIEYAERKKILLAGKPKKHIDQYGESVLTTLCGSRSYQHGDRGRNLTGCPGSNCLELGSIPSPV